MFRRREVGCFEVVVVVEAVVAFAIRVGTRVASTMEQISKIVQARARYTPFGRRPRDKIHALAFKSTPRRKSS